MQPPVRRRTIGPMCGLMASPSGPPLFMLGTRPAGPWPLRHLALARHTTMNKRLSTISYQLSAALVLTTIGYLPSAFAQVPASGQADPRPRSIAGTTHGAARQAAYDRTAGKIQHATRVHLPAGDRAAHDFAIRSVHQLPGERRCQWQ